MLQIASVFKIICKRFETTSSLLDCASSNKASSTSCSKLIQVIYCRNNLHVEFVNNSFYNLFLERQESYLETCSSIFKLGC